MGMGREREIIASFRIISGFWREGLSVFFVSEGEAGETMVAQAWDVRKDVDWWE